METTKDSKPMDTHRPLCAICRHYAPLDHDPKQGECRRNPPSRLGESRIFEFVPTGASLWCGKLDSLDPHHHRSQDWQADEIERRIRLGLLTRGE